ncbi:T9SS type A sorting domain-containing protein [Cyclobacterium marinum]|uniref:Ig domain protein group 1 domain protein n=1 Tax=Cyclobacterium marinum (strain ATCC 25205 / DSM 745 / LMG 13164 / NCIMB 1802) TaxID=880070 RepID=G0IYW5_CYCMS|nr:T9SS type A sorting domain-containing protein [Cyclobacterium marinum]AEL28110.1 Ig domain protein group 1 domain protein [Cyclobacterium marinum DSM 745]
MKQTYSVLNLIFLLFILPMGLVYSQNGIPDNKGKEFWLMFNRNFNNSSATNLDLFITSDLATNGQVILPDETVIDFSVTPGTVTTVNLPSTLLATLSDGVENKGVNIIADSEITIYGLNQYNATTDAFLGLPLDVLGTEYIVMSYITLSATPSTASAFGVVATMDGTVVTIVPSIGTNTRPSGVPYEVNLNKGETYQLIASVTNGDLTGSFITSNNPVAVFTGHTCAYVPQNISACDHLIEQAPPVTSLGESFVTIPLASRRAGDIYRIVATKDGTSVSINGTGGFTENFTLNAGDFHELSIPSDVYTKIESDQAILVAQFSKGQSSDNVTSDPFMMLIPPFEQFQNSYTVSTPATGFSKHFINLAVPTSQKDKIELDGAFLDPSIFTDIPGSTFAGAQVEVSQGTHNISGNLAFGAFMYGFGSYDSYGYPGGQALASVEQVRNINLDIEQEIQQGTTYCFNSSVTDDEGVPIFGVRVDFEVEGVNEKIGFALTDEQGIANFCFDAINEGTDKIIASVGSTTAEATVSTTIPRPDQVLLNSLPESVTLGEEICLTSQILDQFDNPMEGEMLFIEYMGNVIYSGESDENGMIEYCFTPEEGGDLLFTSYYEGGDKTETTVMVAVPDSMPTSISIDAASNEINLGQQVCVTATVKDQFGKVMEGVEVQLEINGVDAGSEMTDENGVAEFCKTAEEEDGELLIFVVNYVGGGSPASTSITVLNSGGGGDGGGGGGLIASAISITNISAEVNLGEEACVESLVLDQNGDPLPNTEVTIEVNGEIVATLMSDEDGIVAYCIVTESMGDLSFAVNYDGGTPATGTVKIIQVVLVATTISVEPSEGEVSIGTETCLEVEVLDQLDNPFGVIEVFITKNGEPAGSMMTNEDGVLNYCFNPDMEGEFEFGFYYTVENTVTAMITVTDNVPIPTIISFEENEVEVVLGEEVCLAATILDQFGMPLAGVEVSFDVNGVFYGKGITDENGRVELCGTPDELGDLMVTASYEGGEDTEAIIKVVTESDDLEIESFWLVDAGTNTIIREIMNGDIIPYSEVKDKMINMMVITDPEKVGSVKLELESLTLCPTCSPDMRSTTENVVPYAVFGDINGDYTGKNILPGVYEFAATPFEMKHLSGNQGVKSMVNFEVMFEGTIDSFTLVNATDDTDIIKIMDGDVIDLSAFKDKKFNIRSNVPEDQQGGIDMMIEGPVNFSMFEKVMPFALFGDNLGDYAGRDLPEGSYTMSATAYPFKSTVNRGIGGATVTINFEVIHNSKIDKFTLVNADTDEDIMELMEGSYIDLNQYKNVKLNIRADGKGDNIAAMTFQLSGAKDYNWTERKAPYAIFGDLPANDYAGKYLNEGKYKLMVTPYNADNTMGESMTVNFIAGFDGGDNLRIENASLNQLEANTSEGEVNNGNMVEDLKVYPQPSQNVVNFLYPSSLSEDATVMIYKGNGQLIHGSQMGNTPSFNFGRFGSGLYLIHVSNGDRIISKKVFIY